MSNIAALLKTEIIRLSRKTVRQTLAPLQSASSSHRLQLAALKKQVQSLEREVAALRKQAGKTVAVPAAEEGGDKHRYSAKGLRSLRARLDLSAEEFGKLIDVSAQSVYNWEAEKTLPRQAQVAAIAGLRGIGKKEARARLEQTGTA
ncbi:MAG TPA: helix-turn-helix domain-containing protein [Solimonas sp.]